MGGIAVLCEKGDAMGQRDRVGARQDLEPDSTLGNNLDLYSHYASRARQPASWRSMMGFFAAWLTRNALGCAVAPRILILRMACSMTANMDCRR